MSSRAERPVSAVLRCLLAGWTHVCVRIRFVGSHTAGLVDGGEPTPPSPVEQPTGPPPPTATTTATGRWPARPTPETGSTRSTATLHPSTARPPRWSRSSSASRPAPTDPADRGDQVIASMKTVQAIGAAVALTARACRDLRRFAREDPEKDHMGPGTGAWSRRLSSTRPAPRRPERMSGPRPTTPSKKRLPKRGGASD